MRSLESLTSTRSRGASRTDWTSGLGRSCPNHQCSQRMHLTGKRMVVVEEELGEAQAAAAKVVKVELQEAQT